MVYTSVTTLLDQKVSINPIEVLAKKAAENNKKAGAFISSFSTIFHVILNNIKVDKAPQNAEIKWDTKATFPTLKKPSKAALTKV